MRADKGNLANMFVSHKFLNMFTLKSQKSNTTYHRVRSELWGMFSDAIQPDEKKIADPVKIPKELFRSIKSALTSRSADFNDDKKLAFDTAIEELISLSAEAVAADEESDVDDEAKRPRLAVPAASARSAET